MLTAAYMKLMGRTVRFRVRDVYQPEPASILHELHDDEELEGKVVDLSDCGCVDGSPFVLVDVSTVRRRRIRTRRVRLHKHCIVSVDRLLRRKKAPVGL